MRNEVPPLGKGDSGGFAAAVVLTAGILIALAGCGGPDASGEAAPKEEVPATKQTETGTQTDKQIISRCKSAVDRSVRYLSKQQNKDGSYGRTPCVGITGLCVRSMAECHRKYREGDGPFMSAAVEYILKNVQDNGGIYNKGQGLQNYRTSVAITALAAVENPEYKSVIEKARDFVVGLQCREESGYDPWKHPTAYGGIGYGGDLRPDITNTWYAVDALKKAGLPKDSPVWKRVRRFISRCQHNTEGDGNDQPWATDEAGTGGGFVYMPGNSKAGTITLADGREVPRPYGSATYMGVLSLIYADVKRDDPRIRAAYQWMRENFTVEKNPGTGKQGLYYYYAVLAKCLYTRGERYIVTPDGERHDWPAELSAKLIELQNEDGRWANDIDRWWEGDPALVTGYSITALSYCVKGLRGRS